MSFAGVDKHRFSHWRCICECGKVVVTRGEALRRGHTKSCGCFQTKHGLGTSKTYYSWVEMKRRCLQPNSRHYERYGARGIKVCKRWLQFLNFLEDMGIKPDGTTLDRINGKLGYYKANCRWATDREQIINRSLTRWITYKNKTLCLADWANNLGIAGSALSWRLDIAKWPKKDALTLTGNPNRRIHRT